MATWMSRHQRRIGLRYLVVDHGRSLNLGKEFWFAVDVGVEVGEVLYNIKRERRMI